MQADTIRLVFTYLIATLVIAGGGLILFATRLDPSDSNSQNLQLVLAGFIGAAVQFVFSKETATSTSIQTRNALVAGQATTTTPRE